MAFEVIPALLVSTEHSREPRGSLNRWVELLVVSVELLGEAVPEEAIVKLNSVCKDVPMKWILPLCKQIFLDLCLFNHNKSLHFISILFKKLEQN